MTLPTKSRISKAEKLELALKVREIAVSLSQKFGSWQEVRGTPTGRSWGAKWEGYTILYRTPFDKPDDLPGGAKYFLALTGKVGPLPYGIDVWKPGGGKILLFEWAENGPRNLVTLKVDSVREFIAHAGKLA
jgi:hypothetical protein